MGSQSRMARLLAAALAVAALPGSGRADQAVESICREAFDSSGATAMVLPLPLPDAGLSGPAPADAGLLCDWLALQHGLGWFRLGDCLLFALPTTFRMPVLDFDRPMPGHIDPGPLEEWRLMRGNPYTSATQAWLTSGGGRARRSLVDHGGVAADLATEGEADQAAAWLSLWAGPSARRGVWTIRARQWPWFVSPMVDDVAALSCGPVGDVPDLSQQVELPLQTMTLGDILERLASQADARLVCDSRMADTKLVVAVSGAALNDILASVAFCLAATWRDMGECLYLGDPLATLECARDQPAARRAGNTAVLLPSGPNSGTEALAAGSSAYPLLEIRWSCGTAAGRTLIISFDRSRGVVRALPSLPGADGQPRLHCAAEAVAGLAEAEGRPLDAAQLGALAAQAPAEVAMDGNGLVSLAASAGLNLVGASGSLDELASTDRAAVLHFSFGHYACVSELNGPFALVRAAEGRRGRFPTAFLEEGFSGHLFLDAELAQGLVRGAGL
jgi:hypothetical protein